MPFLCEIVTQERQVYSGEAEYVSLPGTDGRMGVLPNHAPMLTSLSFGEVMVRNDGEEEYIAVGGGFAEIQPDHVIVLADSAEYAKEIDIERAEQAREKAEQAMSEGVPEDAARYAQIEAALRRAQIRIDVSMRRSGARRRRLDFAGSESQEETN